MITSMMSVALNDSSTSGVFRFLVCELCLDSLDD